MFGTTREEVVGGWRRRCNEELCNLYTSPNFVRVIISRRMRCVGLVSQMGEMRNELVRKLEGRDYSEDVCTDGRIILECILRK
jgi:hypothetical protein